jgi:hypothetical protein
MPVIMDLRFNSFDSARQWFVNYHSDSNCLANPVFIADGADSRIEIDMAPRKLPPDAYRPPPSGWRFFEAFSQKQLVDTVAGGAPRNFYDPARVMNLVPGALGDFAYCFDPDPTVRGRYKRVSGNSSWVVDDVGTPPSHSIVEKLWPDKNHTERVLEIILGSWMQNRPVPHPGSTPHKGWATTNPAGTPPTNDWRNATITFDMRCQNLELGPQAKICQHVQGLSRRLTWAMPQSITFTGVPSPAAPPNNENFVVIGGVLFAFIPATATPGPRQVRIGTTIPETIDLLIAALGATTGLTPAEITAVQRAKYSREGNKLVVTTKSWPAADGSKEFKIGVNEASTQLGSLRPAFPGSVSEPQAFPNLLFTKQLISDQLGFGTNSWGKKNKVSKIFDSGRVPVVLQFTPNDADWDAMGSIEQPTLRYFNYVVTPVAEILQDLIGNSYMLAVHPRPQADGDTFIATADPTEKERISGKIMIYGIKVEVP